MECPECNQELMHENFSVRLKLFPARLKEYEGKYVLTEFDCPHCKRDGVACAAIRGFVKRMHFSPQGDPEEVMP